MPNRSNDERLRPAPAERFEGPSHLFDLEEVVRTLRSEDQPARDGHRQMTIYRGEHITHVVFAFEAGGALREHSAPGLVTILVHRGRIRVRATGNDHELSGGRLLVLNPEVPHDVYAEEDSVMLLTVHVARRGE